MHFDTDGVYTLLYTAEDSCGNETIEEREVIVGSPRTVIYSDGTFIINEQPKDFARNATLHGTADYEYDAMLDDGSNYVFSTRNDQPWFGQVSRILSVEMGETIQPISIAHWFNGFHYCASFDLTGLNTSLVTDMTSAFRDVGTASGSHPDTIDVSDFDTSNVTTMASMFHSAGMKNIDLTTFDTSKVTDMSNMFYSATQLVSADLSGLDVSNVTNMNQMFVSDTRDTRLTTVDLSGWDTSSVTDMAFMFYYRSGLTTIYASPSFVTDNVTTGNAVFLYCVALVGGAGTTYNSSRTDKTYARIDGGTADPGYFTAKA